MAKLQTKKTQVIILLGPPGSGKGSQAHLIRDKMGIAHISTGDLLRENIRQKTPLGIKAKHYVDAGLLGPDELVFDMLFDRVAKPDCKNGYILDGFPRNISQAEALQTKLPKTHHIVAISLKTSDATIIDRITKRLVCKLCQAPYHLTYALPKEEGKCDQCGGQLYQRSDDTREVIEKRLDVYRKETAPLIDYYEKQKALYQIDSSSSKEAILLAILRIIQH